MTITRRSSTILAYAVGGTLFAAALYLSFELGRYRAGYAIIDAQRQAGALEELIAARDATIESLRRQEAILETSEDIDRETHTRIEATLGRARYLADPREAAAVADAIAAILANPAAARPTPETVAEVRRVFAPVTIASQYLDVLFDN